MKKYIYAIIAITMVALAVACSSTTGSGSSSGGSSSSGGYQRHPEPWDSTNASAPNAAADQQAHPVASADAEVPGNFPLPKFPKECDLYVSNLPHGIRLIDGINLGLQAQLVCTNLPALVTVAIHLQYQEHGTWVTEGVPMVDSFYPTLSSDGGWRRNYTADAVCYPGLWKATISWSGIKSDGHTPFPNAKDGDSPGTRDTDPIRMNC